MTSRRLGRALRTFPRDVSGAVSTVFAYSLVPLAAFIGLAMDYGNALSERSRLQGAVDAAVLAAAKRGDLDANHLEANARELFVANGGSARRIQSLTFVTTRAADGSVTARATGGIATSLLPLLGIDEIELSVTSTALPDTGRIEVALALDNTGSMGGTRLDTLKTAANGLIDKLYSVRDADQKVKVALVPFAQYVNVGMENRSAPWMSVPDDYSETRNVCWDDYPVLSRDNCHMVDATGYNDGVPYAYQYEECDITYGPPTTVCADQTSNYQWNGCAGSRDYPADVISPDVLGSDPVPGLLNTWCPSPITRLTNDKDDVKGKIDAMNAVGETYIPSGLIWGWRTLAHSGPFGDALDPVTNPDLKKALILMTDGANTKSPNYPDHEGSDPATANTLTAELCSNIKDAGITVFTVAFDVDDAAAVDMLRTCATSPAYAFTPESAAQLADSFEQIGGILAALRLSD